MPEKIEGPKTGRHYEVVDCECPEGHRIHLGWIDAIQCFVFCCETCDAVSNVAAAYDATGRVRKCIIKEREQ